MNKVAFAISYILLLITAIVAAVLGLKHGATIGLACLTAIAFAWSYGMYAKETDEESIKSFAYSVAFLTPITAFVGAGLLFANALTTAITVLSVLGLLVIFAHLVAMILIGDKEKLPLWTYATPFAITCGLLGPYIELILPNHVIYPGFAIITIIGAILAIIGLFIEKK